MSNSLTEKMLAGLPGVDSAAHGFQVGYLISFLDSLASRDPGVARAINDRIEMHNADRAPQRSA